MAGKASKGGKQEGRASPGGKARQARAGNPGRQGSRSKARPAKQVRAARQGSTARRVGTRERKPGGQTRAGTFCKQAVERVAIGRRSRRPIPRIPAPVRFGRWRPTAVPSPTCCAVMPAPGPTRRRSRTATSRSTGGPRPRASTAPRTRCARPASGRATACCGWGRTPSASRSCCSPVARSGRCSVRRTGASSPDELAFVIDDLAPAVVVWQEEEVGPSVRAGRASRRARRALDPPRQRRAPGSGSTRNSSPPAARPIPTRTRPADAPLLLVYTAAFDGRPNAAMLPSRALIAQGLLMAPWSGIDAAYVFLNSGPLFHIGTFMPNLSTFVMGGTNVFVRRSDGEELCRAIAAHGVTGGFVIGPMVDAIVAANADGQFDLSTFRGQRGNPQFDTLGAAGHLAVGPAGRWLRTVRSDGHGDVQPARPRRHRHARPAVTARRRARGRPRRRRGPGRRDRRDRRAGQHGHVRVLEPVGAERAPVARRLAPHQRPRTLRSRRLVHVRGPEDAGC